MSVHEFREQLVHVINSNNLPVVVTQLILNEVKNAVDNEAMRIVAMEKQKYEEESIRELQELRENNQENENKENDSDKQDSNKNNNESEELNNANTN